MGFFINKKMDHKALKVGDLIKVYLNDGYCPSWRDAEDNASVKGHIDIYITDFRAVVRVSSIDLEKEEITLQSGQKIKGMLHLGAGVYELTVGIFLPYEKLNREEKLEHINRGYL